ncbi:EutN/CcmL family microcompartment protein [Desulfogranum japonicum]|uniref:EutN/CcmL family microcompartment protein n=1 Tax=Desulfogranum japonicum TaxID=231447 RepID=UPI0004093225|nr:EutN/CcmL family microcompartment protein [Desulfogranum japonicum]
MLIGQVIGTVVATRKHELLSGSSIQIVQLYSPESNTFTGKAIVALDVVGAGEGETVVVVTGSSARIAMDRENVPVDAAIVGIVDQLNVEPIKG